MKTAKRTITGIMAALAMLTASTARAGDLTPPGAPGSTMKSLTEVHDRAQAAQTAAEAAETAAQAAEPRTAIAGAVTINQPGSYYLAENISGQITIQADNVTLDLMGFRIAPAMGSPPTGSAIEMASGYGHNTIIRNGTLHPNSGAVALDAGNSDDCRFEDLRIEGYNDGSGISVRHRSLVRNCVVRNCTSFGIHVGDNTEVRDNHVSGGAQTGIRANWNCRIQGNRVENHGGRGIHVEGEGTVLADNTVRNNSPDFDLHAATVQVPSARDLQQQIADTQQQIADLKLRMGATGMAETFGGMVLIPEGAFLMGDAFTEGAIDERPVHTVTVSAFYMDQYQVTKALWDEVHTYATGQGYSFDNAGSGKGTSHPVHWVNWYDCVKWANARSQRDGLTPVYYADDAFTTLYKTGTGTPFANWSANGYRLPTEAEWEKAARGGAEGRRFPWADANTIAHTRANYNANPSSYDYDVSATVGYHPDYSGGDMPHTSPVGSFAPNGYGLYDMAGNVQEWCWDWYGSTYYSSSPVTNPHGPTSNDGRGRVLRGGIQVSLPDICRVAFRNGRDPDGYSGGYNSLGFRLVRTAQ